MIADHTVIVGAGAGVGLIGGAAVQDLTVGGRHVGVGAHDQTGATIAKVPHRHLLGGGLGMHVHHDGVGRHTQRAFLQFAIHGAERVIKTIHMNPAQQIDHQDALAGVGFEQIGAPARRIGQDRIVERADQPCRDQIDRFGPQAVVNNEFTPNFIGGSVQRNPNPASWLIGIPNSGPIETTVRRFLNLGETRVKGIDYEANAKFKMGTGTFGLSAQATWIIAYNYQFEKGGPTYDGAGNFLVFETPKLRGNWGASFTEADYSVFFRYNYTGGWDYGDPSNRNGNNLAQPTCYLSSASLTLAYLGRCQVKAWTTLDIGGSYTGLKNWVFSGVLRNIENKRAPYDPNQTTLGFNPSFHNPLGEALTLTATYRFK